MSNDRRRGQGRPFVAGIALAALALLALASHASAQSQTPSLDIMPAEAMPGEPIVATLHVPATLVDLSVQDHIACVLAGTTGEQTACEWSGAIVDVRVVGQGVDYVLALEAPDTPGDYTLSVTRTPYAGLPAGAVSAGAPLVVLAPPEDLTPGEADADGDTTWNVWAIFGGSEGGDGEAPGEEGGDAARWIVSATTGTATLLVTLAGSRRFGGRP